MQWWTLGNLIVYIHVYQTGKFAKCAGEFFQTAIHEHFKSAQNVRGISPLH